MDPNSSKFEEVAELFQEAYKARKIIWHDTNETIAVQVASGEIEEKSRIIRLDNGYCLTTETLGRIHKRGIGHIAVMADALEVLRFEDPTVINNLYAQIQTLVEIDKMSYTDEWHAVLED